MSSSQPRCPRRSTVSRSNLKSSGPPHYQLPPWSCTHPCRAFPIMETRRDCCCFPSGAVSTFNMVVLGKWKGCPWPCGDNELEYGTSCEVPNLCSYIDSDRRNIMQSAPSWMARYTEQMGSHCPSHVHLVIPSHVRLARHARALLTDDVLSL